MHTLQPMPTSAVNRFPSNSSPSSRMLPPTTKLAKLLHPLPSLLSQSVRSIIPAASSDFRKSLRCTISGLNSHNPQVCRVYNHGLSSSLSLWPDCATPRTDGPSTSARPKLTKFHPIAPRFPSISCSPLRSVSIASTFRSTRRYVIFIFRTTLVPPIVCIVAQYHVRLLIIFFRTIPSPTRLLIVCTNRNSYMSSASNKQITIVPSYHPV